MNWLIKILLLLVACSLSSCATFLKIPNGTSTPKLGEKTNLQFPIKKLPPPKEKIVVGVYKFRDQTGQYKAADNGGRWRG